MPTMSKIINGIHMGLCLYVSGGWMLPTINSKILVGFIPCIYVNWMVDNNKCILTKLEKYYHDKETITHKKNDNPTKDDNPNKDDNPYIEGFISSYLKTININLSDNDIHKFLVFITFHSFIQSYKNIMI